MNRASDRNLKYDIQDKVGHVTCRLISNEAIEICECEISVSQNICMWDITSWFTKPEFMNQGFGRDTMKQTLCYCLDKYGTPASVRYIWNGANAYVLEWLEQHFDATCICPIAVQKTQAGDDWDSHIYELEKAKVFAYFGL